MAVGCEIKERVGAPELWFGIAKVTILPPRHLHIPVLGIVCSDKYIFPLCQKCALESRQDYCDHSDAERAITSTWHTSEIQLALSKSYKLIKAHELYHFPPNQRSTTLFRGLIRSQFEKKVTASPVPANIKKLKLLITITNRILELSLKPDDFCSNPALRSTAKLSINCFWGFFAVKVNSGTTCLISSLSEYLGIENDPDIEIKHVSITADEKTLLVTYKQKKELPGKKKV